MQEEKSILSKTYTPVAVSESATVTFNKVTVSGIVTINGRIVRNSEEIGQVSYNTKSGALRQGDHQPYRKRYGRCVAA